ncbi:MAG: molybdenum ABC transporter ATP-binding protein [Limnohabitans sp.]|nr:MAG: molybdenum ABC transporter ATP-binding protein [Limnohabitans sp.]
MSALHIDLRLQRPGFTLQATLQLPPQGVTVLWGASGSGKTSLLRCVAGLERGAGRVQLGDTVWQDDAQGHFTPVWERRLGVVFQEASLFDHLDVQGNLHYGLRRLPAHEQGDARLALDEAVQVLGIGHLLTRRTTTLSGGERQRVAMARALAARPRLLLLDEPLAALDSARKREVLPWLDALRLHLQVPMLYVTHAADEVAHLADTLVVLDGGQVRASGPVAQVLSSVDVPIHLGDDVGALVTGTVSGCDQAWGLCRLALPGGELWVSHTGEPEGTALRVRILARDVSITLERAQGTSIQNHLHCVVEQIAEPVGHQVLVRLNASGTPVLARLTARAADQLQLRPGMPVWAQIKAVSLVR